MMLLLKWVSMEVMVLHVFVADVVDDVGVVVEVASVDLHQWVLVVGVASRAILFDGIIG